MVVLGVISLTVRPHAHRQLCDLAEKYKALLFIDECHATGFIGQTGR